MNFKKELIVSLLQQEGSLSPCQIARMSGLSYRDTINLLDELERTHNQIKRTDEVVTYIKEPYKNEFIACLTVLMVMVGWFAAIWMVS